MNHYRTIFNVMALCAFLLGLQGCSSTVNVIKKDTSESDYALGVFSEGQDVFTFSVNNEYEAVAKTPAGFTESSVKVEVPVEKLNITFHFDERLKDCQIVKIADTESLKKFVPKSPKITSERNHSVKVLLVSQRSFFWTFSATEDQSVFAVAIPDCAGNIPNAVYKLTTDIYHELFHLFNLNSELDPFYEEETAHAIQICSLLTSEADAPSVIEGFDDELSDENIRKEIEEDKPRFSDLNEGLQNSITAKYTAIYKIYHKQNETGSYAKACQSLYGL